MKNAWAGKYGALVVGLGLLAGCSGTTSVCTSDGDCTEGETCETLTGTCSCVPGATPDPCTQANSSAFCRADTKRCETSCATDNDCPDGETCNTAAGTCGCTPGATPDKCTQADSNAVCHVDLSKCVTTCADDAGCPTDRKCDPVAHVCRTPDKIDCTATGFAGCGTGFHCNTTSKRCTADCTSTSCTGGQTCNNTTKECETPVVVCSESNPQPDTCANGQICVGTACTALPTPTCANFTAFGSTAGPGTAGPFIYSVTAGTKTVDATFCGASAPNRLKVHIKAYNKNATFPSEANKTQLDLKYVREDGTVVSKPGLTAYTLTNSEKNVEFDANLCLSTNPTTLPVGFFITGGNFYCASLTF